MQSLTLSTMQRTLLLTAEEQKLFTGSPASLREGWTVKEEALRFADTPEKRALRLRNLHISNKALLKALKKARSMKGPDDLFALSSSVDFSAVPESEILELYYVMGPQTFSDILNVMLLRGLKTPEDMKIFVSNALVRHELLVAMNLPPQY